MAKKVASIPVTEIQVRWKEARLHKSQRPSPAAASAGRFFGESNMKNPFVMKALSAALAAASFRQIVNPNSSRYGRDRSKGAQGKAGDKLARMAFESRLGVRHP